MLAIYNGKEYVCRDNSRLRDDGTRTKCWLELRSHTKDDEAFSLTGDGWYTKMVYGEECTEIRDITVFAEYNNESIQILYRSTEEVCVCADSSSHYSEAFVDVILGGQEGRDVYSWRKLDAFTGFHFLVYDYVETENPRYINERIIPVTKDEAEQYLKLAESEWKNSNRR